MIQLEKREWCEFWWEETGPSHKKRILLIGDSITKGYYPFVKEILQNEAIVDKLATSKAVGNPSLLRELDYMLRHPIEYRYDAVHFNNGLHGQHLTAEEYERCMEDAIQYLLESTPTSLVLALSTPVTEAKEPYRLDSKVNAMVTERNQVLQEFAAKYRLPLNDLYTPMLGKNEYGAGDGYHFNEQGRKAQAVVTAKAITSIIT